MEAGAPRGITQPEGVRPACQQPQYHPTPDQPLGGPGRLQHLGHVVQRRGHAPAGKQAVVDHIDAHERRRRHIPCAHAQVAQHCCPSRPEWEQVGESAGRQEFHRNKNADPECRQPQHGHRRAAPRSVQPERHVKQSPGQGQHRPPGRQNDRLRRLFCNRSPHLAPHPLQMPPGRPHRPERQPHHRPV